MIINRHYQGKNDTTSFFFFCLFTPRYMSLKAWLLLLCLRALKYVKGVPDELLEIQLKYTALTSIA